MSRIGKKQIIIPAQTEISVAEGVITVKGPKGSLTRAYNPAYVSVEVVEDEVKQQHYKRTLIQDLSGVHTHHTL